MRVIKTENTNHNFGPPPGQEDVIGDLPCQTVSTREAWGHGNGTVIFSVWQPTPEERRAICNGSNIRLGVGWLGTFPPVSVGITDEKVAP
jgi:hypothetical protein